MSDDSRWEVDFLDIACGTRGPNLTEMVIELVHEIERLQGELIERDTAIDSAIRYQYDADWRKELLPFYRAEQ